MASAISKTAAKVNYGTAEQSQGSKTFNSLNPEATNENLVAAINEMTKYQDKPVLEVLRIDTTVISG